MRLSTDYAQVVTEDLTVVPLLTGNDITSFSLAEQVGAASIDAENRTVSVLVPFGTDLTALSPTFALSQGASSLPASGESQDFTSTLTYTVTAEDGTETDWTVSVTEEAEVAKGFQTFALSNGIGEVNINQVAQEVAILVPSGTNVTAFSPEFTIDGSGVSPASGVEQDFTNPVVYTITGSDGSGADWTVSVTVASGFAANINFQDRTTTPPAGYLLDYGKQFGHASLTFYETDYAYGWKLKSEQTPIDASDEAANNSNGVGRNRIASSYASASDQEKLEGTLVHFQGDNILSNTGGNQSWSGQPRGNELIWEMEVPNGIYEVTVGLGDAGTDLDSRHSATVEGYTVVPAFAPEAGENRNGTVIVEATDGLLTINVIGGYNSKINYIELVESSGTPVSGQLGFDPALVNSSLAPGSAGVFSSTLTGAGAGNIGLVIDDNINTEDKLLIGSNDWLSLPETAALGSIDFSMDASALAEGDSRTNTIIATAQGYQPAILQAVLSVATPLSSEQAIETFALQGGIGTSSIDAENEAVTIEVPFGTDVTTLTPEFTISGASVTPASGTTQDFTDPLVYTVVAADGTESEWTVTVLVEAPDPCSPWSLLDCNGIPKALPLRLEFDGTEGGLEDGSGVGTGFTMVDPHSEARLSADLPVTYPEVIGYEPSKMRINAGGPEVSFNGKVFDADNFFEGGKTYTNTSATVPALYQTERSSTPKVFGYNVPVPNGTYEVTLHFAEIFHGATGGGSSGTAGQRVFDVSIEDALVLDDLDINAEVGSQTVLTESFEVTVTDGELNMNFTSLSGVNQPKLSAFEIVSVSGESITSEIGLRTQQENAPMLVASPMEGSGPLMVKFSGDLLGTADPELSYYWDFGNGNASKEKNPVSIFTEAGVYEVKARISKYGVPIYTETLQITVFEDDATQENDSSVARRVTIEMYPNPASTFLNLTLDHETEQIAEVRIFDLRGRLVNTFVPGDGHLSKSYEISVNDLPAGVYFVSTITHSGHMDMQRLIVVR